MLYPMYIDGKWYEGNPANGTTDVFSPIDNKAIGRVPNGDSEDVDRALKAAHRETVRMEEMGVFERAAICVRIANSMDERRDEIARVLTTEHGKTFKDALGEVAGSAMVFREAAEHVKWLSTGHNIPCRDPNIRAISYRRPRGVYLVISPWNFPIGNPVHYYLGPGLAAGNTIVWCPAFSSSAVASVFMKCFEDADVPPGVINLVLGKSRTVKEPAVKHSLTAAIGFTGSTIIGNTIASQAGAKPTLMELGGNGPSIVLDDADLEVAAECLLAASFLNSGQLCTSTERALVSEKVADRLVEIIKGKMGNYRLGDPWDDNTTMGPVHERKLADKILFHINDAVAKGAKVVAGGGIRKGSPNNQYIEPTVLDFVPFNAEINNDETFGPVLPIVRFREESELPGLIGLGSYGLAAAVFSRDMEKAMKMAEKMKFGYVSVNSASGNWDPCFPAGGTGGSHSGHGRCGGRWSLEEMTELRIVTLAYSKG